MAEAAVEANRHAPKRAISARFRSEAVMFHRDDNAGRAAWGAFAAAMLAVACGDPSTLDTSSRAVRAAAVGAQPSSLGSERRGMTTLAYSWYAGTEAVGKADVCGAPNLSGTIPEVQAFLDARPSWLGQNFFWTDGNVWGQDWIDGTDDVWDGLTATGYDGSDSSFISYIATHGVTSGGVYTLLAGTPSAGGCTPNSSGMGFGNQWARYVFLSTCQSVKIGNGDDPDAPGENPYSTWYGAARGARCILGYSSNMVDNSNYGAFFWKNRNAGSGPTKAFLDASWQINPYQVPAVICFGGNVSEAYGSLDGSNFYTGAVSHASAAWRWYYAARALAQEPALQGALPRAVAVSAAPQEQAARFDRVKATLPPRAEAGAAAPVQFTNEEAVAAARTFLQSRGLADPAAMTPDLVRATVQADSEGHRAVVEKSVVFHQRVGGVPVLGDVDEVRVSLDGEKRVVELSGGTRSGAQPSASAGSVAARDVEAQRASAAGEMLAQARRYVGESADPAHARLEVKRVDLVYAADRLNAQRQAPLVFRGQVSVSAGGFEKLYQVDVAVK